ncbi:MFS general substrate transporter [Trichoderma barbatum]
MTFQFYTTTFGQLVRFFSGNKIFQYPNEIDPLLWKKFLHQETSEHMNLSCKGPSKNEALEDGYGSDDPEPLVWKNLMIVQLCVLNFAVYMASSIYVPGELGVMEEFGVSEIVATWGLSLFTLGYGVGPMLWSPLSEMPKIGRSGIFFWTLFAFILLQFPVGFALNITVFLVFRWVTDFCRSPCLSTGAGTITDLYDCSLPVSAALYLDRSLADILVPSKGWLWTIWIITWICTLVMRNILYKRAKRLRKATGDNRLRSQSEIDAAHYTARDYLIILARASTLIFSEPIVLLMNLYAGLLYGVLFIWFESFPIVFGDIYGFNQGEQGLVYLGIFVFALLSLALFLQWISTYIAPTVDKPGFAPEMMVPIIGTGFFSVGVVTLFNSLLNYLGIAYPTYAASIFSGSALFRASFGASFPLFARQLFYRLGVGPGNLLLGGIAVLFIPVAFVFHKYGGTLRRMRKNARHDL